MENHSNFNSYPHRVFASVALIDGKIVSWKIGNYRWTPRSFRGSTQPNFVLVHSEKVKLRTRSFVVQSQDEHFKAFDQKVKAFFRQYPIHEQFDGLRPY